MASSRYEIVEKIAELPSNTDFHIELNLISWYGNEPKLDLRKWNNEGKAGKGISLTEEEFKEIFKEGMDYVNGK